MKRSFLWALILVLTSIGYAQAQTKVTGKVTDGKTGAPVPFASVVVKGTTTGVTSDDAGSYSISVPANATTLIFSSVGYENLEETIGGRSILNVLLTASTESLDQVLVIGYGQTRRFAAGSGSVGVVKSKALDQVPVTNLTQMLQGQSAGVQVSATSGRPGAAANIVIRGVGSLSAGTAPLYIIDGVPASANDFSALNANDVESVNILKDASSTSIYGSRGAGGVVLVTTKSGKLGQSKIEFRALQGFSTRTVEKFRLMNSKEKLTYERSLNTGWGGNYSAGGRGNHAGPMTDEELERAAATYNTDWLDEVYRTGRMQQYEINVSGGSEKTTVFFSGSYFDNEGIVIGTSLKRFTGRLNATHQIRDWVKITNQTFVGHTREPITYTANNAQNPIQYAFNAQPYSVPFNPDGSWSQDPFMNSGINIFEMLANNIIKDYTLKVLNTSILDFQITKDLKFSTSLGLNYNDYYRYQFNKPESRLSKLIGMEGWRYDRYSKSLNYTWTNVLNYKKTLKDVHNIDVMLGSEMLKSETRVTTADAEGFLSGLIDDLDTAAGPFNASGYLTGYTFGSVFFRGSYNYDERYFFDASVRRDGSSRFGSDNVWGTFGSIGGAWNIAREDFMSSSNIVNSLKLRASYGTTGNFNIGNYQWRGAFGVGSYNELTYSSVSRLPNEHLTWEKARMLTIGVDYGLFENRLRGSIDYYYRKSISALLDVPLPISNGISSRIENVGELVNKGIELTVGGDILKQKDWLISATFNYTYNKNEVTKLYDGQQIIDGTVITKEGLPMNTFYLTRYAGVNPVNGDALFYTENGSISNNPKASFPVVLEGKSMIPTYFGGFGFDVVYKNLSLTSEFYFSGGNYILNNQRYFQESDGSYASSTNQSAALLDAWQKPGDISTIPRQDLNDRRNLYSTRWLEKGDYFRFRNVVLSYNLSNDWLKRYQINNVRLFAQVQNLFTITKFQGLDPEIDPSAGVFLNNYPVARVYTFGLDLSF